MKEDRKQMEKIARAYMKGYLKCAKDRRHIEMNGGEKP